MNQLLTITVLRYPGAARRWWPRVRRFGSPWRRMWEIDWLRFTVVVRS